MKSIAVVQSSITRVLMSCVVDCVVIHVNVGNDKDNLIFLIGYLLVIQHCSIFLGNTAADIDSIIRLHQP